VKLDYRSRRGPAIGLDSEIHYGKDNKSVANITTYYLQDQNPNLNGTALPRKGTPTGRYRLTLKDRTEFTDDIHGIIDISKLSDAFLLQDFFPGEFRFDPAARQRRSSDEIESLLHPHRARLVSSSIPSLKPPSGYRKWRSISSGMGSLAARSSTKARQRRRASAAISRLTQSSRITMSSASIAFINSPIPTRILTFSRLCRGLVSARPTTAKRRS
jgi:hypothetical protein